MAMRFFAMSICLVSCFSFSMEEKGEFSITIVDENNNQNIAHYISDDTFQKIFIFGATPRLTRSDQCTEVLLNDLTQLTALYKKSKRMKGVDAKVKQCYQQLCNDSGFDNTASLVNKLSKSHMFNLFFRIGINQDVLTENVARLVRTASTTNSTPALIHVMLPCYFNDVKNYDDATLHLFLQTSASFLKEIYTKAIKHISLPSYSTVLPHVFLLIPALNHFTSLIQSTQKINIPDNYKSMEKIEKDKSIIDTLDKTIVQQLSRYHAYTLINPTAQGIQAIADTLSKKHPTISVDTKEIHLNNSSSLRTITTFIPYTLKLEKDYSNLFKQSLLVNQNLVLYYKERSEKSRDSHDQL